MSTVLEPNHAGLMGQERYRANRRYGFEFTAYVSDTSDRMHWERCFAKLREMKSYEVDWDDEGGQPPALEVVALAQSIAKSLRANHEPAPTRCHATDEGHIIMAWDDGSGYCELEIDESLICTARCLRPGASRAESAIIELFSQSF